MSGDPALNGDRRIHAPARGILYLIGGGLAFTSNDAIVKSMTASLPVGEMMSIRGFLSLLLIVIICAPKGLRRQLRIYNPLGQFCRGLTVLAAAFLFLSGLKFLPIADAVAAGFVGPLFLTALAPFFLGEQVGWRRWSAVLVGFAGMAVMMNPGQGLGNWALLFPMGAALAGAIRDIMTRRMSARESAIATLFYTTLIVAIGGLASLPFGWHLPTPSQFALLAISSVLICIGQYLTIEAFRYAEAAAISPFKYSTLIWAVIIGFLVWGDVPHLNTVLGAGLIIACGLYILARERHRR